VNRAPGSRFDCSPLLQRFVIYAIKRSLLANASKMTFPTHPDLLNKLWVRKDLRGHELVLQHRRPSRGRHQSAEVVPDPRLVVLVHRQPRNLRNASLKSFISLFSLLSLSLSFLLSLSLSLSLIQQLLIRSDVTANELKNRNRRTDKRAIWKEIILIWIKFISDKYITCMTLGTLANASVKNVYSLCDVQQSWSYLGVDYTCVLDVQI
jgi:hypothetical protein